MVRMCSNKRSRIAPNNAQSPYLLAMTLTEGHQPAAGGYHYLRALNLSDRRRDPFLLAVLVCNLDFKNQMADAHSLADSDEAGRVFRFQAGQHSNMKPATVPI